MYISARAYIYTKNRDRRMTGSIIQSQAVRNPGECATRCWVDMRCLKFNFIVQLNGDLMCEMIDKPYGTTEVDATSAFYEISREIFDKVPHLNV